MSFTTNHKTSKNLKQNQLSNVNLGKRKNDKKDITPLKKQCLSSLKKDNEIYYKEVENILDQMHKDFEIQQEKLSIECSSIKSIEQIQDIKQTLEKHGFIILKNAISSDSTNEAKINLGKCINDMWNEALKDKLNVKKELLKGNIQVFDEYRNSQTGCGNSSFGFFYKQFISSNMYPKMELENEEVSFDHNSIYAKVNLPLLTHKDNLHSLAIFLSLTHIHGIISWDSVKYARNPSPKPKKMTKQALTEMHIDFYGNELQRYQAIDNVDKAIKLFFVPGSNSLILRQLFDKIENKKLFDKYGYIRFKDEKLCKILSKFAIAPPPYSRIIWKSGVVHFEGAAKSKCIPINHPLSECYYCDSIKNISNSLRFRFVIGNHLPLDLSQNTLMKLAIAAERGLCPAIYNQINKDTKVGKNIVNRKSTQYRVPRNITDKEIQSLNAKLNDIKELTLDDDIKELCSKEIPSNIKRLLYGIKEPISNTMNFSKEDIEILQNLISSRK